MIDLLQHIFSFQMWLSVLMIISAVLEVRGWKCVGHAHCDCTTNYARWVPHASIYDPIWSDGRATRQWALSVGGRTVLSQACRSASKCAIAKSAKPAKKLWNPFPDVHFIFISFFFIEMGRGQVRNTIIAKFMLMGRRKKYDNYFRG